MGRMTSVDTLCLMALMVVVLVALGDSQAESSDTPTCSQFVGNQWALVSIVDDEGFALHESDPLHHKLPVELHLIAVTQPDRPEPAPVMLCMDADSWTTGVASCGFPLEGVGP